MASIKIENVQKAFGKTIAVDQLNLDIKEGEFLPFLVQAAAVKRQHFG